MTIHKLNFVVVTHVYATGPAFILEDYLKDKAGRLLFIGHPFSFAPETQSFFRTYQNGLLIAHGTFPSMHLPDLCLYIQNTILTLWWVIRFGNRSDCYIGADNLNAFAGILLKTIRQTRKVIFYTIDYVPKRFENIALNSLYHFFDRFAIRYSDTVWNLSPQMMVERERNGISERFRKKQLIVPIGTDTSVLPLPFQLIDRYKLVYMGHLVKKQGVEILVEIMPQIIQKIPKAHLLIIGGGPLEEKLRERTRALGLGKSIQFTGFLKRFSDVHSQLRDAAVGVAPYMDTSDNFTRFADPGKLKDYIASGMPVVVTKVPPVAAEFESSKSGIAVPYGKKPLISAITTLLSDTEKLKEYRKNAWIMAKKYSWNTIFDAALRASL